MSHHLNLKRLHHDSHSIERRSALPNDGLKSPARPVSIRLEIKAMFIRFLCFQFKPGPQRARRGGARSIGDRHWHPTVNLPKRVINYDLAESFVDHSSNPLSSDLYRIRFKHSAKQWPNGRFATYKEKLDRGDRNPVEILCTRTYPLVPKRKKLPETKPNEPICSTIDRLDPTVQEQKKKQADKQTSFYANLFGSCGKAPRVNSFLFSYSFDEFFHSLCASDHRRFAIEPNDGLVRPRFSFRTCKYVTFFSDRNKKKRR